MYGRNDRDWARRGIWAAIGRAAPNSDKSRAPKAFGASRRVRGAPGRGAGSSAQKHAKKVSGWGKAEIRRKARGRIATKKHKRLKSSQAMQAEWIKVNQAGSNQSMILSCHDSVGFALARRTVTRKCYGPKSHKMPVFIGLLRVQEGGMKAEGRIPTAEGNPIPDPSSIALQRRRKHGSLARSGRCKAM